MGAAASSIANLPRQPDWGGKLEGSAWRRQFTLTDLDDEILLGMISPQLKLLFGSLNGEAGPVSEFAEAGPGLETSEQLAVDFVRGDVWLRDLEPAALGIASIFGILPRPLRWTRNFDVDLLRISWPSMLTLDTKPLCYDFETVSGNATEVVPTDGERATAKAAQAAWREIIGPRKRLDAKYPRGDGSTQRIRNFNVDAESLRFGRLRIEARDVTIQCVDAKGRVVKHLGNQLKRALKDERDGCVTLHKKITMRRFTVARVDEPGEAPAIALSTPVVAQVSSTKFVENSTDAQVHYDVNVSSSFTINMMNTFLPNRPAPRLPPDQAALLPKPPSAPLAPPKMTFQLGVLPPTVRVPRLTPLKRISIKRGAYRGKDDVGTLTIGTAVSATASAAKSVGSLTKKVASVCCKPVKTVARGAWGLVKQARSRFAKGA